MQIKSAEKNGITYKNISFGDMAVGEEDEIEIRAKAYDGNSKFGKFTSFKLKYKGEDVSCMMSPKVKSAEYGVALLDILKRYGIGDRLRIKKKQGTTKTGDFKFTFYEVERVGGEATQSNLNFSVDTPTTNLTEIEKQLVEGLKTRKYSKEEMIEVCMKNRIEEQRAKFLVENLILK